MSWQRVALLAASAVLGALLLAYLLAHADLDLAAAERLISGLGPEALVEVTLLLGFNCFLASEKWRLIDRHLGTAGSGGLPRASYFAFTSIGVGLGQLMPAPLSVALCRSFGAHLYGGRGLLRGTTATLVDQFFDLAIAGLLGLVCGLVVMIGGGALTWIVGTLVIGMAAWVFYGRAARLLAGACRALGARGGSRVRGVVASLGELPLLAPGIGRRLLALSALRFGVLVLIGAAGASAVPLDVPLWRLAASLPFGIIANALAITPGGLGFNEWATTSALFALGTSFQIAVQWAVVNRVLVAAAAVLCGIAGVLVAATVRWSRLPCAS